MSILNKLEAFKVEIEDAYLDLNERATDYKGMLEDTEEQIEELKNGKMFDFDRWDHVANMASQYPVAIPEMPSNEDELLFETLSSNIK